MQTLLLVNADWEDFTTPSWLPCFTIYRLNSGFFCEIIEHHDGDVTTDEDGPFDTLDEAFETIPLHLSVFLAYYGLTRIAGDLPEIDLEDADSNEPKAA